MLYTQKQKPDTMLFNPHTPPIGNYCFILFFFLTEVWLTYNTHELNGNKFQTQEG